MQFSLTSEYSDSSNDKKMKDYYRILGLNKNASNEDIKKAYRKLAKEFHPDRNANPIAETYFKEIVEAYSVLSDNYRRQLYDNPVVHHYETTEPSDLSSAPQTTPRTIFWGIYILVFGIGLMVLQNLWNPDWWNPRIGLLTVILGLCLIVFGVFLREKKYIFKPKM